MKNSQILFISSLLMLSACQDRPAGSVAPVEDVSKEVVMEELKDAPAEQVVALTETVELDSTDMDRNYKYDGTYIYVSKSKMRLYVLTKNDSVLFSCGIACGIRKGDKEAYGDYRTPEGHFRISGIFDATDWIHKTKDGRKVKGCYGPTFLRLATGRFSGIGIHGTNAPGSIGRRASEGCIRVNSKNIIALRDYYAYEGMPVIVGPERERIPKFLGLGEEISSAKELADYRARQDSLKATTDSVARGDSVISVPAAPASSKPDSSTTVRQSEIVDSAHRVS